MDDKEFEEARTAQKAAAVSLDEQFRARSLPELELAMEAKRKAFLGRPLDGGEAYMARLEATVRFAHACDPICLVCKEPIDKPENGVMIRRYHGRNAFWLRRMLHAEKCTALATQGALGFRVREYTPPSAWAMDQKPFRAEAISGLFVGASL